MFPQNGTLLKTQMRVIDKSLGWLCKEKHFDSTLASMVISTLPSCSKTSIVLCLVACKLTMVSLRKTPALNPLILGKYTCHQVASETYQTMYFIKQFRHFYFVYQRKEVHAAYAVGLLFLVFKPHTSMRFLLLLLLIQDISAQTNVNSLSW